MIRYSLLTMYILFFSAYSLKDWYRGLLGLLFLAALMERPDMPEAMFGIIGLSPFNVLLAFVVLGWMMQRSREPAAGRLPNYVPTLLWGSVLVLLISTLRMIMDLGAWPETRIVLGGEAEFSIKNLSMEYFFSPIKWAIPGLLIMSGCRTEQRVRETIAVFAVVVVVLAIQIIKLMPPGFITDGYALQKRALRVIGRDIGYHRNQVSVWMASGFWLLWIIMTEFKSGALKVASFVAAIVTFYALIMTGSRGGLLTWALAGGVFAWVRWRRLFFIGPIIVVLAVAFIPALQERMTAGFSEEDVAQYDVGDGIESDALDLAAASAGRTILWTYSWPKIEQKIVLGWGGNGMLRSGVSLELWRNYEASMTAGHPHNAYLELMFDVGLLGALIMLSLYFISARKAYRMFKDTELLPRLVGATGIAWVTSYLISGVTASTFYPNEGSIFVWAVMGMVISIGLRQHAPAVSSYRGQHRASPSTS